MPRTVHSQILGKMRSGKAVFASVEPSAARDSVEVIDAGLEVVPIPWHSYVETVIHHAKLRALLRDNLDGLDGIYCGCSIRVRGCWNRCVFERRICHGV